MIENLSSLCPSSPEFPLPMPPFRMGRWVAYQSYPDRSLWRSRIDGSERLQLTYPPTHVFYPRISPDGTKVAYGSEDENGIVNAYIVSMDGGVATKIMDNAINAVNWSPDGNSVVANVTATPGVGAWNSKLPIFGRERPPAFQTQLEKAESGGHRKICLSHPIAAVRATFHL